ncbi:hypothetical protein ES332_A12G086100v1 [Gossypium tomentosum]|uniref:Uncharacterized protein n=1 Tax=Gossypium tomentosum TaxID=34277 RepID=A0A5D2MVM8_GOSTO|nr:hypothetical protein ES332_A12G086100v1 [Gossypium tomentosum]
MVESATAKSTVGTLKDYFFHFCPHCFIIIFFSTTASMFTNFSIYKALNTIAPHQLSAFLLLCISFSSFLKFSLVTQVFSGCDE